MRRYVTTRSRPLRVLTGVALCLALGCRATPSAPPSAPPRASPAPKPDPDAAERERILALEREYNERQRAREAAGIEEPAKPPAPEPREPTEAEIQASIAQWSHGCHVDKRVGDCVLLEMTYRASDQPDRALEAAILACDLGEMLSCSYAGVMLLDYPEMRAGRSPEPYFWRACEGGSVSACKMYAELVPADAAAARDALDRACRLNPRRCI